jgi:flavin-dependent dehydrogenase
MIKRIHISILFLLLIVHVSNSQEFNKEYDVVIYGATSSGISAAIQCSRLSKTVLLIEPTNRIGGLTTGGLGATDIGNKNAIGGISREFYQNIKNYYSDPLHWKWQDKITYTESRNNKDGEDAMWTFEPSVALQVYKEMMANESIDLVYR